MKALNDSVIREAAARKFRVQKQRNVIACMAVMLTTFLVYTIFSIGLSFRDSMERQEVILAGTDADLLLAEFTDRQKQELQKSGLCRYAGVCTRVASLSRSSETQFGIIGGGFLHADDICQEKQLKPAMTQLQGRFPQQENEILIPGWLAQKMGHPDMQPGTQVTLNVYYGGVSSDFNRLSEDMDMTFTVCGIYEDKSRNYLVNKADIYVSRQFLEAAPFPQEKFKQALYMTLKEGTGRQELLEVLELEDGQELEAFQSSYAQDGGGALGIFLAVLIVLVCGALIIYNVLSLSAAQDIRFLGQMKTLGVTKRQLKKYLRYQIWWLCLAGIPAGFALAVPVSVFLVPFAVNAVKDGLEQGVSVSFSPVLFTGTALLVLASVLAGSLRPLHVAGSVSPVLAARYVNVTVRRKKERRTQRSAMPVLAWRNVFRSRKSAVSVFLSLFLAVLLFFTLDGLLSGFSASAFVGSSMYYDLAVHGTDGSISEKVLGQIRDIPGVASAEAICAIQAQPGMDSREWLEVTDPVLQDYCDRAAAELSQINEDAVKNSIQDGWYAFYLIGIGKNEFERISKACGLDTDYEAFRAGKTGIWMCGLSEEKTGQDAEMAQGPQTVCIGSPGGERILIPHMEPIPVPGSVLRHVSETAPNILISSEALDRMADTFIEQVNIQLEHPQESARVQETVQEICGDSFGITIDSRQEKVEKNEASFSVIWMLGTAMSLILFFIGIMNFINTIYAGILARQKELAMLECIGMSKKQVKQMLVAEGIYYMLITAVLVLTIGSVLYWQAYRAFTKIADWAQFRYPFRAAGITGAVLAVMAISVPLAAYHSISKESAMEQLRSCEE